MKLEEYYQELKKRNELLDSASKLLAVVKDLQMRFRSKELESVLEVLQEDLIACRKQGWLNYVNFLKTERMIRGTGQHLQSPLRSGNSFRS